MQVLEFSVTGLRSAHMRSRESGSARRSARAPLLRPAREYVLRQPLAPVASSSSWSSARLLGSNASGSCRSRTPAADSPGVLRCGLRYAAPGGCLSLVSSRASSVASRIARRSPACDVTEATCRRMLNSRPSFLSCAEYKSECLFFDNYSYAGRI